MDDSNRCDIFGFIVTRYQMRNANCDCDDCDADFDGDMDCD